MTGTLAQPISIASYGNHFLRNGLETDNFERTNSTFQFCNKVDFRDFKKPFLLGKPKEIVVATNPSEWFRLLKNQQCQRLRLYYQKPSDSSLPSYKLAGFVGGGGTWFIEAVYEKFSNYWTSRWDVTRKDAPDSKIWTVNYGLTIKEQKTSDKQADLGILRDNLDRTLQEIAVFAFKQNLKSFGKIFDDSRKTLTSVAPQEDYYHKDLVKLEHYSVRAKQILFAAASAWVFGGMGSWNDLGFDNKDDNEQYERLSTQLFDCINDSLVGSINSF